VPVADPNVQAILNRVIYWQSVQGLANGLLMLVLVVTALITEIIDRNFVRGAIWCLCGSLFSWVGLMHSQTFRWGAQPTYAAGWLVASGLVFSAQWWKGESETEATGAHEVPALAPATPAIAKVAK
jgi:hypothetical protein